MRYHGSYDSLKRRKVLLKETFLYVQINIQNSLPLSAVVKSKLTTVWYIIKVNFNLLTINCESSLIQKRWNWIIFSFFFDKFHVQKMLWKLAFRINFPDATARGRQRQQFLKIQAIIQLSKNEKPYSTSNHCHTCQCYAFTYENDSMNVAKNFLLLCEKKYLFWESF